MKFLLKYFYQYFLDVMLKNFFFVSQRLENVIVKFLKTLNYKLFVQQFTILENTYNNMHNFFKYISAICISNFYKVGCSKEK